MIMHSGGTAVAKGLYWNPVDGARIRMKDNGILPADQSKTYLRLSPVILLVVAPLFGVSLIFFLPFFGIGVLIVLCLLASASVLSTITSMAVRVCCRTGGRIYDHGAYKPLKASYTGRSKRERTRAR